MVGGVEPDSILAFFANVLPLAGCDVVEGMVASEFDAAELVGCDGHQQLMKSTLQGENYIGMALADAACESFALSQELEKTALISHQRPVEGESSSGNTPALQSRPGH